MACVYNTLDSPDYRVFHLKRVILMVGCCISLTVRHGYNDSPQPKKKYCGIMKVLEAKLDSSVSGNDLRLNTDSELFFLIFPVKVG